MLLVLFYQEEGRGSWKRVVILDVQLAQQDLIFQPTKAPIYHSKEIQEGGQTH
jgi:hypothetical protein